MARDLSRAIGHFHEGAASSWTCPGGVAWDESNQAGALSGRFGAFALSLIGEAGRSHRLPGPSGRG